MLELSPHARDYITIGFLSVFATIGFIAAYKLWRIRTSATEYQKDNANNDYNSINEEHKIHNCRCCRFINILRYYIGNNSTAKKCKDSVKNMLQPTHNKNTISKVEK